MKIISNDPIFTRLLEGETQFGTWPSTIVIIIIFLSDKLLKNFRGRVVMFQGPNVTLIDIEIRIGDDVTIE